MFQKYFFYNSRRSALFFWEMGGEADVSSQYCKMFFSIFILADNFVVMLSEVYLIFQPLLPSVGSCFELTCRELLQLLFNMGPV